MVNNNSKKKMLPKTDDIHPPPTEDIVRKYNFSFLLFCRLYNSKDNLTYNNNTKKLKHYELY